MTNTVKLNWGHKITMVIVAFILIMLSMVFFVSKQTNEMLDRSYYEKELLHQNVLDKANRFSSLAPNVNLISINDNGSFVIRLPAQFEKMENGVVEFINWGNEKEDYKAYFSLSQDKKLSLIDHSFNKGTYLARIDFEMDGKKYYTEQTIKVK